MQYTISHVEIFVPETIVDEILRGRRGGGEPGTYFTSFPPLYFSKWCPKYARLYMVKGRGGGEDVGLILAAMYAEEMEHMLPFCEALVTHFGLPKWFWIMG
jgi:hypothetical protein